MPNYTKEKQTPHQFYFIACIDPTPLHSILRQNHLNIEVRSIVVPANLQLKIITSKSSHNKVKYELQFQSSFYKKDNLYHFLVTYIFDIESFVGNLSKIKSYR